MVPPDGNSFGHAGFDELTPGVEARRGALAIKYEADRRAAREIDIARQVQAGPFPKVHSEITILEYAGLCRRTHVVGGACFGFVAFDRDRLGLGIGDASGKAIATALLMANLRSQRLDRGSRVTASLVERVCSESWNPEICKTRPRAAQRHGRARVLCLAITD